MNSKYYKWLLAAVFAVTLTLGSGVASARACYHHHSCHSCVVYHCGHHHGFCYEGNYYKYYEDGRYFNTCEVVQAHWAYSIWVPTYTRCW
jgi:hypothetical protein